ncbi:MAG: hypothetical protein HYX92_05670 [Chloroflexi bacterium]|nr:hypothetical protein [Chloroflexota bacterium]
MDLTSERVYADDVDDGIEIFYQRGWTDGLPVVLPTEKRVRRALEYLRRDSGESLGEIPPRNGAATIEKIVINSVMAGCLPTYLPVVIAAVEAMLEKPFNLNGVQTTTHCVSPLTIVSGPVVNQLGFNSGDGVFGGGSRANAAVGRAVRLIMWNIGGAYPAELDRATLGHPGKYTYCIAENAEGNPWEPIHVEKGLEPEDSAVTVFGCEAPHHIATGSGTPLQTLHALADGMSTIGNNNTHMGGETLVVFGPRAAANAASGGWTRSSIREYLYENARVAVGRATLGATVDETSSEAPGWPKWIDRANPNAMIPVIRRAEDINIVVAGGWGGGMSFSAICPGWGYLGGFAQTKRVVLP